MLYSPSFVEAALGLDVHGAVGSRVCEIVGVDCLDLFVDLLEVAGEGVRLAGEDFSRPDDAAFDASRVQIARVRFQIVGVAIDGGGQETDEGEDGGLHLGCSGGFWI